MTSFCADCPDHEGCASGIPCDVVKTAHMAKVRSGATAPCGVDAVHDEHLWFHFSTAIRCLGESTDSEGGSQAAAVGAPSSLQGAADVPVGVVPHSDLGRSEPTRPPSQLTQAERDLLDTATGWHDREDWSLYEAVEEIVRARLSPRPEDMCHWCGHEPAEGLASINGHRFCHGDDDPSPTCYEMATWVQTDRFVGLPSRAAHLGDDHGSDPEATA